MEAIPNPLSLDRTSQAGAQQVRNRPGEDPPRAPHLTRQGGSGIPGSSLLARHGDYVNTR